MVRQLTLCDSICAMLTGKKPAPWALSDAQMYSFTLQHPPRISFDFTKSFMVKHYSHHTFPVQSPHTMDAILFRDVNKHHCGYRPLRHSNTDSEGVYTTKSLALVS